jgi:hypothetical protein
MSVRGWGGPIATAIGGAVVAGAAQLGVGYGLGVIAWRGDSAGWAATLAWTMWVGAFAVIGGSLAGRSALRSSGATHSPAVQTLWNITIVVAATVGGLAVVPLTALPAREITTDATSAPGAVVAWVAVVGVLLGLVASALAVSSRAIAANLVTTAFWWWVVAIAAVLDGVAGGRGLVPAPLAAWRFTEGGGKTVSDHVSLLRLPNQDWWSSLYLPGALLVLGAAFVIGVLSAVPAARRGDGWIGVALSGAMGPALMATVFLLAAPHLDGAPGEQLAAAMIAPYAVLAGLLGSVAIALIFDHSPRRKPVPLAV